MKKRLVSIVLCLAMCLSCFPARTSADPAPSGDVEVTSDLSRLIKTTELIGLTLDEDGAYHVKVNQPVTLRVTFRERDELEMDMTGSVSYTLPTGIVIPNETGSLNIGVTDGGVYRPVSHAYTINDNILTLMWNQESEYYEDIFRAHYLSFDFNFRCVFDGSEEEIDLGDGSGIRIKVDNTGSVTVNKELTGLKPDFAITDEQKAAMTFELRNSGGEVVKSFTYADMVNGSITFNNIKPGAYTVVETGSADLPNYTFDAEDSVRSAAGILPNGGQLSLTLGNDYEYDKGDLELKKDISVTNYDGTHKVPESIINSISFVVTGPYGYNETFAYSDFVDGAMTLRGLEVGEYTVTEINGVTGYTCTYKVNNEAVTSPEGTAEVTKGDTAIIAFVNEYTQQTASLTVKKTATGTAVPETAKFQITFPDGSVREFTYADMVNGEYTVSPVPMGTFTVTEIESTAQVASYALTVVGTGDVVVNLPGEDKSITVENNYQPLGNLKIVKYVAGDLSLSQMTDAQKKKNKFTVYNSANVVVGTLTLYQIEHGTDTLTNLPVGTYKIVETPASVTDYTLQSPATTAARTQTATVSVGSTALVTYTNTYRKNEFKLTVQKQFADGSYYNADTLPDNIKENTIFTVATGSGTVVATCNYNDLSATLTELARTSKGPYTVTETNPSIPGISITTSVSKDGGTFTAGNSASITLTNWGSNTVVFKNNYTLQGEIKVNKTYEGLITQEEIELSSRIKFTVYRYQDGTYTPFMEDVTLAQFQGGLVVPAGSYYVQEVGALGVDGYLGPIVSTQVPGGAWIDHIPGDQDDEMGCSFTEHFTVEQNGSITVNFHNKYVLGVGNGTVRMRKFVSGLDEIGSDEQILLTDELPVYNTEDTLLYDGITFEIWKQLADDNWYFANEVALEDLLTGRCYLPTGHYRMTEKHGEVMGYIQHVDYIITSSTEGISFLYDGGIEFTVKKDDVLDVEVHNVYTKMGSLKITKTVVGDFSSLTEASANSIKFVVTGPFDFRDEFTFKDIRTSQKYGEKTYSNLPVGTYYVTETVDDFTTGWELVSATTTAGANGAVQVPVAGTATVAMVNTYERMKGSLVISKVLAGEVPDNLTQEEKQAMRFVVTDSSGTAVADVTYDQFADGKYSIPDLIIGNYTVSETISNVLKDNYTIAISGNNQTYAVDNHQTTTATITNTFTQTGSIRIVKNIFGADVPAAEKNTIQFKYWRIDGNGQMIGSAQTVNYNTFADGAVTIRNLVPGTYVVEEQANDTTYIRTVTVQVNGGVAADADAAAVAVNFGEITTVSFNNTYSEVSSIVIRKVITGQREASSLTAAQKAAISFTLTDSEGNTVGEPFTYAEMTSGSKTFSNLAPGEYTVVETVNDPDHSLFGDYTCTTTYSVNSGAAKSGQSVTFTAVHGTNTVAFTNTYSKITPLSVTKTTSTTYVGLVNKDGAKYPVWRFDLNINYLTPGTAENGSVVLSDVFDAICGDWFRLATTAEVRAALGSSTAKNVSIASQVSGKSAPSVEFREINNTIVISGVTDQTANKCKISYYLIVADRDALNELNEPNAIDDDGVSRSFINRVTYKPMPYKTATKTATASYKYEFTAVSKEVTNIDAAGNLYDTIGGEKVLVNYADYKIVLNEDGVTLGNQTTITVEDIFSSNQTVLISSITTQPVDGVSFTLNNAEHKLTFTIPNSTPVTVTYRVNIAVDGNQTVELTNGVKLRGFGKEIDEVVKRPLGGEGGAEIFSFKLVKVDGLNNSLKIPNVTFGFYDGATDELLTSAATNSAGVIQFKYWGETGAIIPGHDYYLLESETPEGYNRNSSKIWVRLSRTETAGVDANGVHVLTSGGELVITNAPVTATLSVTKVFNEWSKQSSFTFALAPVNGAPMPAAGGEITYATQAEPTALFGLIRFPVSDADLAGTNTVTYNYTITETVDPLSKIDGITYDTTSYPVSVVISDVNHDGVKEVAVIYGENAVPSLTVTNKYSEGSLKVTKTVNGNDCDPDREFSFNITLGSNLTGVFSGVEFSGGQAAITLKGGQEKLIEGLPNGISYTVVETDYINDGYITYKTGDTGVISDTNVAVAAFTNTRNTYGSLTVSKTLAGNDTDPTKDFTFTVTLSDTSITGTYGDMEFNRGVASFTLKGGQSKTAAALPNGVTYTVAETGADGYTVTCTGAAGSIEGNVTKTAAFTNTRDTYGSLTVSKAIAGNAADPNKTFIFTVTLGDTSINGTYGDMTFTNGAASFALKGGESATAANLPNGIEYKVVEDSYTGDGYTTVKTGDAGVIKGGETKEAKFTNTRNADGALIITKTLAGNDTDAAKAFTFTITLDAALNGTYSDVEFVNGVAAITLKGGESKTIAGLPNGTGYTVAESDNEGYEVTKTGEIGTISENTVAVAEFTNTRNTFGGLTVSKTVTGNDCDKTKTFTFTVTLGDTSINGIYGGMEFVNGIAVFTLADGESATAVNLPNGVSYTVTENSDGYTILRKNGDTGSVKGNETRSCEFTNSRNTYGGLTVSKTVTGNAGDKTKEFSFTVTLSDTGVNGTYGAMEFVNGIASFTLKDGESKTATGLPNGTAYTVTEAADADYTVTKNGDTGSIKGNETKTASFTNNRDTFGNLTVQKTVTGNAADPTKEFSFTVALQNTTINGIYGDMEFRNGVATFTLKGGESKTAANLPNGIGYTVAEDSYLEAGYTTDKTGDTGYIEGNATKTAAFTNNRDAEGSLTVTKTLAGNDIDPAKEFTFTITLGTALNGTYSDVEFRNGAAAVILKGGESKTIEGLPNGTGYTVVESDNDGYEVTKTGETGTISETKVSVAAFTNTRNTYGGLTVTKKLDGNDTDANKIFTFTVTLNDITVTGIYGDMSFLNGVATFGLKGGESKSAAGLPNGLGYTVTEANYSDDGYTVSKLSGVTGEIEGNETQFAEITNTRNTYGGLTVSKTVAGNAADRTKEFIFTVTLGDTSINGAYGDMTFVAGITTFTLRSGESKTAANLPNGVTYTVVETDYGEAGYETVKDGDRGTIVGGETRLAAFINIRNANGSLTITKLLAGNDTDPAKEFTFTITLGAALTGTYSDVEFADGRATVTLKGGESKTIDGLPNGTAYTVTEADYMDEGYTTAATGETGRIDELVTATATFINTRDTYGDLIITKTLEGNDVDPDKSFVFTITLGAALTGTYSDVEFADGRATVTLKGGETCTIKGLPNGTSYTVSEADYANEGYIITSQSGTVGIIDDEEPQIASITNTRNTYGDLTVTKLVSGKAGETDKDFSFTVTLSDTAINGLYGEMEFVNGVAVFTLKHDESITAVGLPNGTGFAVTEESCKNEGYKTSKRGDTGTVIGGEEQICIYTNTRNYLPDTGTFGNMYLWFLLLFTSAVTMAATSLCEKKKKRICE